MKLALGTVQFGQDYGVSNTQGRTGKEDVRAILSLAESSGVRMIDTAPAYGESEKVLGGALPPDTPFRIVTKTPAFTGASPTENAVLEAFGRSLERLGRASVYGLLVHLADDLLGPSGDLLWSVMTRLAEEGKVEKIGISAYTPDQVRMALDRYPIQMVQVPLNLLDQRLIHSGTLALLRNRGIEVHARSALLQGLLTMDPNALPSGFNSAAGPIRAAHRAAAEVGLDIVTLATRFVCSIPEVDCVVAGVTTRDELAGLVAACRGSLPQDLNTAALAIENEAVITPSQWPPDASEKWRFDFPEKQD